MDDKIDIWTLPENSKGDIIDKIEAMADSIRNDWSDPRTEVRRIKILCQKLRDLEAT